jgi:hypothetical protein
MELIVIPASLGNRFLTRGFVLTESGQLIIGLVYEHKNLLTSLVCKAGLPSSTQIVATGVVPFNLVEWSEYKLIDTVHGEIWISKNSFWDSSEYYKPLVTPKDKRREILGLMIANAEKIEEALKQ